MSTIHWNLVSPVGGILLLAVVLARYYLKKSTSFRWLLTVALVRSVIGIAVIGLGPLLEWVTWLLFTHGIYVLKIVWWGINSEFGKLSEVRPGLFLSIWLGSLPFAVLPGIATALTTLRPRPMPQILRSAALTAIGTLLLADVVEYSKRGSPLTQPLFSALSDLVGGAMAGVLIALLGMALCPGIADNHSFSKHWSRNAGKIPIWLEGRGFQIVGVVALCLIGYFFFIYHPAAQIRVTVTDWSTLTFRYRPKDAPATESPTSRPLSLATVNLDPGEILIHPPKARLNLELQLLEGSLPQTKVPLIVAIGGAEIEGRATASGTETKLIHDPTKIVFAKSVPVGQIVVTAPEINLLFGFSTTPSESLSLLPPFHTRVFVTKDARFFRMLEPGKLLFKPRSSGKSVVVIVEGAGAELGITTGQRLVMIPNAPGLKQPKESGSDGIRVSLPGEVSEVFVPSSPSSCHCGPYIFFAVGDGLQRYKIQIHSRAKYIEMSEPGYDFGKEESPALIEDFLLDGNGSVVIGDTERKIALTRPNSLTVAGSNLRMYRLPNSNIQVDGETQLAVLNGVVLTTSYWGHLPETYRAAIIGAIVIALLTVLITGRRRA